LIYRLTDWLYLYAGSQKICIEYSYIYSPSYLYWGYLTMLYRLKTIFSIMLMYYKIQRNWEKTVAEYLKALKQIC